MRKENRSESEKVRKKAGQGGPINGKHILSSSSFSKTVSVIINISMGPQSTMSFTFQMVLGRKSVLLTPCLSVPSMYIIDLGSVA